MTTLIQLGKEAMGALRIEECFVSQHGLRNVGQLSSMIEFVKQGGRFNAESLNPPGPLIHITRFEDGQFYVQDGHHRMCAIVLAGRPFLFEDEYWIEDWKYKQFLEINFDCNWLTPYNPQTEARLPDYKTYKDTVINYKKVSNSNAIEFITRNRHLYSCQRQYYHIQAMIDRMDLESLP